MTRARTGALWGALVLAVSSSGPLRAAGPRDREWTIVLSRDGMKPSHLEGRKGETLRLTVSTADEEHCFAIDELRVEKRVLPRHPVVVDVTPDRAGRFVMYCCLEPKDSGPHGELVVAD